MGLRDWVLVQNGLGEGYSTEAKTPGTIAIAQVQCGR